MFVTDDQEFDFQKLFDVTYQVTVNLNQVIDVNFYPVQEARKSNMRHRPIGKRITCTCTHTHTHTYTHITGIGVQGLADAFILMRFPFESAEAKQLNKHIFETLYFAALTASKDLAKVPFEPWYLFLFICVCVCVVGRRSVFFVPWVSCKSRTASI